MKRALPLSLGLLMFVACNRYQYATVSSSGIGTREELGFVAENDTLQVVYNFNGYNAPVNITVHNKLDVPVYIDWQRSALIINDKAISYMRQKVSIEGAFSGSTVHYAASETHQAGDAGFSNTAGALVATATLPDHGDFIPPKSYITKSPLGVTNRFISEVPDSAFHKEKFLTNEGTFTIVKKAVFTEATSPLKFKSYLTATIGDKPGSPITYEHSFYVSELMNATGLGPHHVWLPDEYKANKYYVKEVTGFGRSAAGFGVVAGVAVCAATTASLEQLGKAR